VSPIRYICSEPGCRILLEEHGRCAEHDRPFKQRQRQAKYKRERSQGTSTARWKRLRLAVLERDEHRCQLQLYGCQGRATTVHLDPRLHGNHAIATEADCRSACRVCHGRADGGRARRPVRGGGS
jgi:5-methylcytosine-specific restriction endonuclease McrA